MTDQFLMCAPHHFDVAYVINPWMEGNVAHCRQDEALCQWNALTQLIGRVADVESIVPARGLPDMVFTANAGMVLADKFILSRFRHAERTGEEAHFARWFDEHGFTVLRLPPDVHFEGAGDALLDREEALLWLGYGHRSSQACVPLLEELLDIEVEPLRLADERFYHLDTCFCPLEGGYLMYYPPAFDLASQARIQARLPAERRIPVSDADALEFACNAVNSARHIFLNRASITLAGELQSRGFTVWQTPLTEFMKAGGSAKCLTLKLTEEHPMLSRDVLGEKSVA
ncbi:dimethylarginine dimethylaminohydrolase family protein [Noviherbaspirillum massiliense]|uniref:dimethylarginine dimethylaminohydrolase family protein n=1 Tax=Noviherbaspirillum massiliense TaxID=1465823 RepID=UPI000317EFD9|nr:arginine deiminase-related protein [Noviherbaspirillum massiliense]